MKVVLYVLLGLALTGVAALIVLSPWRPANSFESLLVIAYFAFAGIGQWWMIFMVLRHEPKMLPLLLAAFLLPFSFIWYYFERVRPGHSTRRMAPRFQ